MDLGANHTKQEVLEEQYRLFQDATLREKQYALQVAAARTTISECKAEQELARKRASEELEKESQRCAQVDKQHSLERMRLATQLADVQTDMVCMGKAKVLWLTDKHNLEQDKQDLEARLHLLVEVCLVASSVSTSLPRDVHVYIIMLTRACTQEAARVAQETCQQERVVAEQRVEKKEQEEREQEREREAKTRESERLTSVRESMRQGQVELQWIEKSVESLNVSLELLRTGIVVKLQQEQESEKEREREHVARAYATLEGERLREGEREIGRKERQRLMAVVERARKERHHERITETEVVQQMQADLEAVSRCLSAETLLGDCMPERKRLLHTTYQHTQREGEREACAAQEKALMANNSTLLSNMLTLLIATADAEGRICGGEGRGERGDGIAGSCESLIDACRACQERLFNHAEGQDEQVQQLHSPHPQSSTGALASHTSTETCNSIIGNLRHARVGSAAATFRDLKGQHLILFAGTFLCLCLVH